MLRRFGDDCVALAGDYAVATHDTMTDDQANHFIERAAAIDQQFIAARLEVVLLFEKAISWQRRRRYGPDRPPPRPFDQPAIGVEYSCGAHHQLSAQVVILEQGQYIETWSLGFWREAP